MKRSLICILSLAVILYVPAALAQHGHGGGSMGGGGGMGSGHGMGSGQGMGHRDGSSSSKSGHLGPMSPSDRLDHNTKLAGNLQKLLPSTMTPQQACTGFKNLGQCVAAIHVSHNLGIPFTDLKDKMLGISPDGTTTSRPMSLGKAIQALKPTADSKSETKKAKAEADEDLKS